MSIEPLKNLSLIKISGGDAFEFLQGQLTNDLKQLSNGSVWQYSAYCNPKGRVLAIFYIWQHNDSYYAVLESDLQETMVKRLQMYVMRSKVTLEHIADAIIYGAQSPADLADANLIANPQCVKQQSDLASLEDAWVLGINQRALYIAKPDTQNANSRNTIADDVANGSWLSADINEGIPQVSAASSEQFIPQMLNLDQLGGINFKKGCYTGQEIVARMHYLGKLKQRMFYCNIAATKEEHSGPGDKIFIDSGNNQPEDNHPEDKKAAGNIVSVSSDAQSALIVLRLDSLDQACISASGNSIVVRKDKFHYQEH